MRRDERRATVGEGAEAPALDPGHDSDASEIGRWLRRALGLFLIGLALLPGYWILEGSRIGPFGEWVLALEAQAMELVLWGSAIALGMGVVFATLSDGRVARSLLASVGRRLSAIPPWRFALGCGAASAVLTAITFHFLFQGLPTNVDSIATLLQARFLTGGEASGRIPDPEAARLILNTLATDEGWVSLYPPFHTALLALGLRTGAAHLVGPVMTAVTVTMASRLTIEVLPERSATARLAGVLMVVSPFIIFLGGSYLSHTSAAAGIALTAWTAHRARDGSWPWALATGAAVGVAVSARPWTGLVTSLGLIAALWLGGLRARDERAAWLLKRAFALFAGGLPFAVGLFGYNARFFGHPGRLGYEAAYGPSHGLGFHSDPWGYPYGPVEAIGYTAADLGSLGLHLLETPLPLVAVVGLYLVVARRTTRGERLLLFWALLPIVANIFYWHHGFHLGPRMLFEAAPAWCAILAVAVTSLAGASPDRLPNGEGSTSGYLRRIALGAFVAASLGPLFLVPVRLEAHAWDQETLSRMIPPAPPTPGALIFVHGSWSERVSARLQATGLRMDSLETALRRNDLCAVDAYARARLKGGRLPDLDFRAGPGTPEGLESVELPEGNSARLDPRVPLRATCRREIHADRLGTVSLAPLLWQGDLPGMEKGRPMFVRDLGPETNDLLRRRHPERPAFLYYPPAPGEPPVLTPYAEGTGELWGGPERE